MKSIDLLDKARAEGWTDEEVVARVLSGETELYEIVMRRHNQRLYRVVRAIIRDDEEAEDVMQDAYVRAYQHLSQFEGRAPFSAWLTRIAVHESLARVRSRSRLRQLDLDIYEGGPVMNSPVPYNPEQQAWNSELRRILEELLLALPEQYRTVLMMRDVEQMSTAETALALEVSEDNVKVRLHRGRALLRKGLSARIGASATQAFPFMGERCDRMVKAVFERLGAGCCPGGINRS